MRTTKVDQPAHPHSLISTFAVRFLDSVIHIPAKTTIFKAVLLLWFILICYHIYNVCLLHGFVATLRLFALPSALYFILSKLAL